MTEWEGVKVKGERIYMVIFLTLRYVSSTSVSALTVMKNVPSPVETSDRSENSQGYVSGHICMS